MQLEARNVSFRYDKHSSWILKDINLTVKAGERVALVGPSGYGKSTLSKILAGYEKPEEGEILWDGKASSQKRILSGADDLPASRKSGKSKMEDEKNVKRGMGARSKNFG